MTCRFNDANNTSLALIDFGDEDDIFTVEPMLIFMVDGKEVPISTIAPSINNIEVSEDPFLDGYNLTVTGADGNVTSRFCRKRYEVFNRICALVRRAMPTEPVSVVWPIREAEPSTEPAEDTLAAQVTNDTATDTDVAETAPEAAEAAPAAQVDNDTIPATDAAETVPAPVNVLSKQGLLDSLKVFGGVVNIQDSIAFLHDIGLLDKLLSDHATGRNIMWCTNNYEANGDGFAPDDEITERLLVENPGLIKTRSQKSMEEQRLRQKKKAEVFTPVWVCNMMNNYCDESWFGRKDVFNANNDKVDLVTPTTGKIAFEGCLPWESYVTSTRLEITCGEAPFLVSRYDAGTGKMIPVVNRIGQLDRKLRIVNENTDTKEDWWTWAFRALSATYGYEYQGDNLLIARINLFMTMLEYMADRWEDIPDFDTMNSMAYVITWNAFQMNGLTDRIPLPIRADVELPDGADRQPLAVVMDWPKKTSQTLASLKREPDYPAKKSKAKSRKKKS